MNCRSCNTPIPSRSSSCPNCGRSTGTGESFIDDPGASGSESAEGESQSLSSSTAMADDENDDELSLEDAVVPSPPAAAPKPAVSVAPIASPKPAVSVAPIASPKPAVPVAPVASPKPAVPVTPVSRPAAATPIARGATHEVENKPAASRSLPERPASGTATLPDPDTVRAILAEHPELLEVGLEILVDDGGQEIGVQHATDVGVIDLLAHDVDGRLVAVIVAGPTSGSDLVGEALHRLGWVRKHLAKNGEDVRAIVVTDHVDAQLGYAAAAVSDKIKFKSYALSLSLTDLEF